MEINGYDYKFAYTVGAFCDINDLHLTPPKTLADQCKVVTQMAVIMSKAYEDRQKVNDPSYKTHYLSLEQVRALSPNEIVDILSPEVDSAVKEGSYRSIQTEPIKKAKGTAKSSH